MKAVWCWLGRPESLSGENEYKFWYLLLSLYSYGVLFPEDQREVLISEDLQELFAFQFYRDAEFLGNRIFGVSPLKFRTISRECENIEIIESLYDSSRWFAMTVQTEPWCYVDADIIFLAEGKDKWKRLQRDVLEAANRKEEVLVLGGYRILNMDKESAWATQNNSFSGYLRDFAEIYPLSGTNLELTDDLKVSAHTMLMGGTPLASYVVGSEILRECRLLTGIPRFNRALALQGFRESLASYFLTLVCKVRNIKCVQDYDVLEYDITNGIVHSTDWLQFLELGGIKPAQGDCNNVNILYASLKKIVSEGIYPTVENYTKIFTEEYNKQKKKGK